MITIKEIAEQLGVSPTTVSNVINGKTGKMSAETRQRVKEALVRNHYVNESRMTEPEAELKLISINFFLGPRERILTDPFCGELLESIEENLRIYNRYMVCSKPLEEEHVIRLLSANNIEGGIVLGYPPAKCAALQRVIPKPIVFIDCGEGEYDNVGLQDLQGTYEIVSFLIKQGHRKIAFFCDEKEPTSSNRQRFQGFLKALETYKILFDEEDFYYLPIEKNLRYEVLRQFARGVKQNSYTAGFFCSDLLASEAVNVFFSQNLKVPDDLSVAGFDDNIYARLTRPMLTTVRQSPTEKGREAVKLLMKRIYGQEVLVNSLQLPTELIVRDSVRNIVDRQRPPLNS